MILCESELGQPESIQIVDCGRTLTNSQLTVEAIDPLNTNPLRRYDMWYTLDGGATWTDAGPSVQFDPNGMTFTTATVPTNGGTVTVGVVYWDDPNNPPTGNTPQALNNGLYPTCDMTLHTAASGVNKLTFQEIENRAPDTVCFKTADHYLAEYALENPTACQYDVDEVQGCISIIPDPDVGQATPLPAPSGNDDSLMLAMAMANGGKFTGLGRKYRVTQLRHSQPTELFDMDIDVTSSATQLIEFDAPNCLHYNVKIDGLDSRNLYQFYRIFDSASNYRILKGECKNMWHRKGSPGADNESGGVIRVAQAQDGYLAGNEWFNIRNDVELPVHDVSLPTIASARAVWMNSGGTQSVPRISVINNRAWNFQSNGNREDAEFFVVQGYLNDGAPIDRIKVLANYCEDGGKRFTKFQDGGGIVAGNTCIWATLRGDLAEPERKLRTVHAVQLGVSNVWFDNNRVVVMQPRWEHINVWNSRGSTINDNLSFDCNDIDIQVPHDNGNSGGGQIHFFDDPTSSDAVKNRNPTNSTMNDNIYRSSTGNGDVKAYYWLHRGMPDNLNWLTLNNNQENVPFTVSRIRLN